MTLPLHASGTFELAGRTVHRLGFGAMRITGPGIWGPPEDRGAAIAVLRRAVELGVDFIDTADSYGPTVSEELIHDALHPYGDVLVATKAGLLRTGPGAWHACGRPEYLRQQCELSLRRLGVEAIDLFQLHRIDPTVDRDEQFALLAALLDEGKVRAVGLSEVGAEELAAASAVVPIATVQNDYNVTQRRSEPVLGRARPPGSASSRTSPWRPAGSRGRDPRWQRSRAAAARRPRRSRSRGCSRRARSSCRSPARPRSRTSRRTAPPSRSSSPPRTSPTSTASRSAILDGSLAWRTGRAMRVG